MKFASSNTVLCSSCGTSLSSFRQLFLTVPVAISAVSGRGAHRGKVTITYDTPTMNGPLTVEFPLPGWRKEVPFA